MVEAGDRRGYSKEFSLCVQFEFCEECYWVIYRFLWWFIKTSFPEFWVEFIFTNYGEVVVLELRVLCYLTTVGSDSSGVQFTLCLLKELFICGSDLNMFEMLISFKTGLP